MSFPQRPIDGSTTIQNGIKYIYSAVTNSWRRDFNNILDVFVVGGNNFIQSVDPNTGNLRVLGGAGIQGNLSVGGNLLVNGTINANNTVYLNPPGGTVYIQPTQGGTVIIAPNATGSIDNVTIGANSPSIGVFTDVKVTDTQNSVSSSTGALTVAGGAGITKDLYVGGKLYASQFVNINNSATWYYTSSSVVAKTGDKIWVDTSVNTVTITLPSIPTIGDTVQFVDYKGTFDVNNCYFAKNGQYIMGLNEDLIVDIPNAANYLVYSGVTQGWKIGVIF